MVFGPLLSNGRQRVGAFKNASVSKKYLKHTRIQWNVGTTCVSECVLKTLWRVGVCVSALLRFSCSFSRVFFRPALSGGMDWWRMEWSLSRVRKIFFQRLKFTGKLAKIPPNFRLRNLKNQSPKKCNSIPKPFHTPTTLPPILDGPFPRKSF